jgi:O-antigen ligase
MAITMAVVVIFTNSSFGLGLNAVYYLFGILFLILILLMENRSITNINFTTLGVIVAGLSSILFNDIPRYFKSEQRFLMFICFILLIGPLVNGVKFNYFRKKLFYYLNILIIIFCSLSFLLSVLGVYRGHAIREDGLERPDFSGLFNHSMVLCPMSGIAILSCLYLIYSAVNTRLKFILLACILLCFLSAVVAGSRSALMGVIAGVLFFFYKLYRNNMGQYLRMIITIVMMVVVSFPLWEENASRLIGKVAASEEQDDWASSRTLLWESRLDEFKRSPIIGVGFAAEDIDILYESDREYFENSGGKVEPGSSWLVVLSMTGILGFLPILVIFLADYAFLLKSNKNRLWHSYLGGILVLLTVHMFAEGYIYAFGAMMFFYLWLVLGIIEITKFEHKHLI